MSVTVGTAVSTANADASTDDPSQARADIKDSFDRINQLAGKTLIQDTDLSNNGSDGTVAETSGGGFPNVNADVTATDEQIDNTTKAITTQGDLIIGDGSGDASRLAVGSASTVLRSDGTTPSYGKIVQADITAGAIGQSEVAAGAIGQAELKSTSGTVTASSFNGSPVTQYRTLPGGQYGFAPDAKVSRTDAFTQDPSEGAAYMAGHIDETSSALREKSNWTTSYVTRAWLSVENDGGNSVTLSVRQLYVQSSPPYDMGDGECGLFVEADVRADGSVAGLYVAPDPVFANNGPTDIKPQWIDKEGRGWRRERQPALTRDDLFAGRCDLADYVAAQAEAPVEEIEVTAEFKRSDMNIVPHSWASAPQGTICLLDPVNTHVLLKLHEDGEDVAELIHKGYIQVGDPVSRKGPSAVTPVGFRWKNTG